jgi:hypothetical protein
MHVGTHDVYLKRFVVGLQNLLFTWILNLLGVANVENDLNKYTKA